MSRRKKSDKEPYIRKSFETRVTGEASKTNEKIVGLCLSQLMSEAWGNLTGNARNLYIFMRLQYNGSNEYSFNFNRGLYEKRYKLYSGGRQFNKDRQQLIDNGFIRIVEDGTTTRTKTKYAFSDEWQNVKRCRRDMSKQREARKAKK